MAMIDESFSKDIEATTEDGSVEGYVPALPTRIPGTTARKRDRKSTVLLLIVVAIVFAGLVTGLAIYLPDRAKSEALASSLSSALNFTGDDINGGSGGDGQHHHGHHKGGHKKPKHAGCGNRTDRKNDTKYGNHSYVHIESDFFN